MGKSQNTSTKPSSKPAKAASKFDPPLYAPLPCTSDKASKAAFDLYYHLDEPAALLGTLHMTVKRSELYAPVPHIVASLITCIILLEIDRLRKRLDVSGLGTVADKKKFKKETKRDVRRLTKILHDKPTFDRFFKKAGLVPKSLESESEAFDTSSSDEETLVEHAVTKTSRLKQSASNGGAHTEEADFFDLCIKMPESPEQVISTPPDVSSHDIPCDLTITQLQTILATPKFPSVIPAPLPLPSQPTPQSSIRDVILFCNDISVGLFRGRGTFGDCFEGSIISTGEPICIKEISARKQSADRTQAEVDSLELFSGHRNFLKYYQRIFGDDGLEYIITELADMSLEDLHKRVGAMPHWMIAYLGKQMLEMLVQLQEHSTSHRDIKPANILYMADSAVLKLGDFGTATPDLGRESNVGSPFYLAPEVGFGIYDCHSIDVYAFAMSLWHLACDLSGNCYPHSDNTPETIKDFGEVVFKGTIYLPEERATVTELLAMPFWNHARTAEQVKAYCNL